MSIWIYWSGLKREKFQKFSTNQWKFLCFIYWCIAWNIDLSPKYLFRKKEQLSVIIIMIMIIIIVIIMKTYVYLTSKQANSITKKVNKVPWKRHQCGLLNASDASWKPCASVPWTFSATPFFNVFLKNYSEHNFLESKGKVFSSWFPL